MILSTLTVISIAGSFQPEPFQFGKNATCEYWPLAAAELSNASLKVKVRVSQPLPVWASSAAEAADAVAFTLSSTFANIVKAVVA